MKKLLYSPISQWLSQWHCEKLIGKRKCHEWCGCKSKRNCNFLRVEWNLFESTGVFYLQNATVMVFSVPLRLKCVSSLYGIRHGHYAFTSALVRNVNTKDNNFFLSMASNCYDCICMEKNASFPAVRSTLCYRGHPSDVTLYINYYTPENYSMTVQQYLR